MVGGCLESLRFAFQPLFSEHPPQRKTSNAYQPLSYSEIKDEILRLYLNFAFERGASLNFALEQVVGGVSYECEIVFKDPLPTAMASTVYLALSWSVPQVFNGEPRSHLLGLLDRPEVRSALLVRDASEREEFLRDLDALGIIPSWVATFAA